MRRTPRLAFAACAWLLACGGDEAGPGPSDAATDATIADAANRPIPCAQTIEDYCGTIACPDYDAAIGGSSRFCGDAITTASGCDGWLAVGVQEGESVTTTYYDPATRKPIAVVVTVSVVNDGAPFTETSCIAGPSPLSVPSSCTGPTVPVPTDACAPGASDAGEAAAD